jgi:hypothetical protein
MRRTLRDRRFSWVARVDADDGCAERESSWHFRSYGCHAVAPARSKRNPGLGEIQAVEAEGDGSA